MSDSDATVVDNTGSGRFEVIVDGTVAGYAEYQRQGGTTAITHTVVDDAYEGRGYGSLLGGAALDAAREAGSSVLPVCPFVRRYIQRHPEYLDLVPVERRPEFDLG